MNRLDKKNILIKIVLASITLIILFSLNNYFLLTDRIKENLQCKYNQEEAYTVNLGRKFTVGMGDVIKIKNTDVEIKIIGFCDAGFDEAWCGGKHVKFSYSIRGETEEREILHKTFEKGGYKITLLKTDFNCYVTMKIEKGF